MKIIIVLLLMTLIAQARIGETLDQCAKRYNQGKTVKTFLRNDNLMGASFKVNGITIAAAFHNKVCIWISYNHGGKMTKAQAMKLLTAYKRGGPWKKHESIYIKNKMVIAQVNEYGLIIEHISFKKITTKTISVEGL